jgi:flagella basal body P-ring formation protein FlgA
MTRGRVGILLVCSLGFGFVLGSLTGYLVALRINPPNIRNETSENMVPVLVTTRELAEGTVLTNPEEMLVHMVFLSHSAPPDRFIDPELLQNKRLHRRLLKGEPITARDLTPARKGTE